MNRLNKDHWLFHKKIAHRGFHSLSNPENSLAAFEMAILQGYAIELDVHVLSDQSVIVFHDDDLHRMTGINCHLKGLTYEDIKGVKLGDSYEEIPLLSQVLKLVDARVPLLIELKDTGKVGVLERQVIELLKDYKGQYAIQAFNPLRIMWLKKHAPHILRGQLSGLYDDVDMKPYERFFLKNMFLCRFNRPDFINYQIDGLRKPIMEYHRKKGTPIFSWTARDRAAYDYALKWSANAVFEGFTP